MDAEKIWLTVSGSLRQYVRRKVSDPRLAEDLLQEIFLKVQENYQQLQDEKKVGAWVFRMARNVIIDHYRQQERYGTLPAGLLPDLATGHDGADLNEEFAACIPAMLEVLPQTYREAIYLSEIEGLSQKELARRLGISYSGAKSRVQRGRRKLREVLLRCCHIHTDAYGNIIDYHKR